MYTPHDMLMIGIAIGLASLVQGYGGFGFGIVAMALLAFMPFQMIDMTTAVSLVALAVIALLFAISRRNSRVEWRDAGLVILGACFGQPLGYWFICSCGNHAIFRIALGLFLIAAGINGIVSRTIHRRFPRFTCIPVGLTSGFLGGAFVTGGPPVVLYLYSKVKDPREMKATVQFVFATMLVVRLSLVAFMGDGFTSSVLTLSAWIIPACIPLLLLGHLLSRKGSPRAFKSVVYALIVVAGISLVAKASL